MPFAFHYAARSDVGMVRSNNEDSGYAGPHLLAMADGMKAPVKVLVSQDRKTMTGVPKGRLMAGAYKVTWRAASADDGHRMDGAFTFTVK